MIKVRNLEKYFFRHKKNEIHVLNDVTIDFPQSGLVVLLGPSGSGKTTLLNVIGGLDNVQKGQIEFDDLQLEGYDSAQWDKIRNERIGYIFQNYNLLPHLSVYDNVALVLKMQGINHPEIIDNRVSYILNAVGMYPYRKKKSTQLSGGQQQRVAIARALVKNPEVIIADEPTGNLDSKNTTDVMNIIKEISKQKLVVLVTHERDMAYMYGDRIIELKDGQIIHDQVNTNDVVSHQKDENIVYLKDYYELAAINHPNLDVSLYQDVDYEIAPIKIQLIIKDKTLYLKTDTELEKIRLIDQSSNIVVKNEHFVKKNKEEMLVTSFRTDLLENKEVERSYKAVVAIRQIFMLALQKILYSSKKGKLMLMSFILAGATIAVAISMAAATIIPNLDGIPFDADYIIIQESSTQNFTLQNFITWSTNDSKLYVNTLNSTQIEIIDTSDPLNYLVRLDSVLDIFPHAPTKMASGRLPIADDEIAITVGIAEIILRYGGAEYGIWDYDYLESELFRIAGYQFKLTGVIDSNRKVTYVSRDMANLIKPAWISGSLTPEYLIYGLKQLDEYTLLKGVAPEANQVVISKKLFDDLSTTTLENTIFPISLNGVSHEISGVANETIKRFAIGNNTLVEDSRLRTQDIYYVHVSNPSTMVQTLKGANVNAERLVTLYTNEFKNNEYIIEQRVAMLIGSSVIIGLSLLGFYFIMHSSMVSRIYEISVYRALGMKKTELLTSFLVEVAIITTLTSLIGYIVASYGLVLASQSLLGEFSLFLVTPLTILIGMIIVYVINIIGGMFPIFLLLRKTPAQILAQYDI
jgi:putative ABC transport system permease protein